VAQIFIVWLQNPNESESKPTLRLTLSISLFPKHIQPSGARLPQTFFSSPQYILAGRHYLVSGKARNRVLASPSWLPVAQKWLASPGFVPEKI
jgi:hypothetical protein